MVSVRVSTVCGAEFGYSRAKHHWPGLPLDTGLSLASLARTAIRPHVTLDAILKMGGTVPSRVHAPSIQERAMLKDDSNGNAMQERAMLKDDSNVNAMQESAMLEDDIAPAVLHLHARIGTTQSAQIQA